MRYALLIALREYLENAKTKGFWIGIFMFPLMLGIAFFVSARLATSNPTRDFVLVDQSGDFDSGLVEALDREHQSDVLAALNRYVQSNLRPESRNRPDLSAIPDASLGQSENQGAGFSREAVDAFVAAGGADAYLARVRPMLRDDADEFVEPPRQFVRVDLPSGIDEHAGLDEIARQLRPYLNGDQRVSTAGGPVRLFAAILIGPDASRAIVRPGGRPGPNPGGAGTSPIQYWSSNLTDRDLAGLVGRTLNEEVRRREYLDRGVSLQTVQQVQQTSVSMGSFDPGKEEGEETVSVADTIVRAAPIAFVYLLWISVFVVVQMLLNNTIEEKSNRIIEVLLSSVTPNELMMGKLIGIAAIGISMVGAWLLTAYLALQFYQGGGAEVIGQIREALVGSGLISTFLVYYVFGYLLYAGIFLSIGSLCNTLKEAQNLQGPRMIVMMVPLLTMVFINRDPHGALATIMTWIPIYTPFTMINRVAAGAPLFDVIGSMVLMIGTTALILWLSGRIFRIGILRTGQPPKVTEVLRWLRGGEQV
jgi:ABC-2 type transport system permease protein